jgi:hypothetical protein
MMISDDIANILERVKKLEKEVKRLSVCRLACLEMRSLMGESQGVDGFHLNGDVADWDWMLGHYFDSMSEAFDMLKAEEAEETEEAKRIS